MNILIVLSILSLISVPMEDSELPEFQYDGAGLVLITPFGSGIAAVTRRYGSVLYLENGTSARYIPWPWNESGCCSAPSSHGNSAAVCVSSGGSEYILLFSPDSVLEVYGPYGKGGRPVFNSMGNLWFTADGYLHKNGISTGIELELHTISVDASGTLVAFCDSSDRICILNTDNGKVSVLAFGYRFYSPVFVTFEDNQLIISPTLEGEIVKVSPADGICTSLAEGSHPFWCYDRESILYSVTSDDGIRITSGEIWLVSLDGVSQQITFTPEIHEIHPIVADGTVYAIDATSGFLIAIPDR
jgi:hypothetical protein